MLNENMNFLSLHFSPFEPIDYRSFIILFLG